MKRILLFIFLLISFIYVIDASHFRFGTISYQPVGTYNNIKFTSNFAYRISFYGTSFYNNIKIGSTIKVGSLKYGFSNLNEDVVVTVNSFDKNEDWFTGDFSVTKQYPAVTVDTEYYVVFTDCCRISTLINNKNGNWNITTRVITQPTTSFANLNLSPVSGMVPIYNVINQRINKFKVVANDPNGDSEKLVFSTTPLYSMSQPSGLTIDSKTGVVTFTPTQTGLYSTQIVVYDAQLSKVHIVVDFLLRSEIKSGFCHESCSNKGGNCNYNSDCKSCTSTDADGNTCTSNVPRFIYPPTTPDGETIYIDIGKRGNFSFQCSTPDTGKTTHIQTANLPTGIDPNENIQDKATSLLSWYWTPTSSNVGSYVVSAVCTDNTGASSTVTSFTIAVKKPICGNGETSGVNQCKCDQGWDPATNCFECLDGYFGKNCTKAPACDHGSVNDGTEGDGKCSCFYGWKGVNCDISTQSFCTPTSPNGVSSSSNSDPSFINPTFYQFYVNTDSSTPAADLGLLMSIPSELSNLNVFVVMDAVPGSEYYWTSVSQYMGMFISKVGALCENAEFGLGFFSDATSGGYNFQLSRVMGDNINVFSSLKYDSISTSSTNNTLGVLNDVSVYPVGWAKGAIKVVLILTDHDRSTKDSTDSINTLKANLISQSILPIIVGFNTGLSSWDSTFASQGFGYTTSTTISKTASSDWVNKAYTGLTDVLSKAVVKVSSDPDGFISSVTPTLSTNVASGKDTNLQLPIKIKYPSKAVSTLYPEVSLSVIGFGTIRAVINYNHPPESTDLYINAKQNTDYTISFPGTDLDGNFLNVTLTSTPSNGKIRIGSSSGVEMKINDPYDISKTKFVFSPTENYYTATGALIPTFGFKISDGCDSVTKTAYVSVEHVNQPPTCTNPSPFVTTLNDAYSFELRGKDIDPNEKLSVIFTDISKISGKGVIKSGSSSIIVSTAYSLSSTSTTNEYAASFTFTQSYNPASSESYSVTYKVRDNAGLEATCSATFSLSHSNVAPVINSITPLGINQNGKLVVNLNAIDSDSTQVYFTVSKFVTLGGGKFFACNDPNEASISTLVTPLINLESGKASYSNLCYLANPNTDTSADSVTFTATDNDKVALTSSDFTIKINVVGLRDNDPPVTIAIPNFSVNEDSISTQKTIDGTDPDELDQGKLTAIIKVQPTNGKIVISKGVSAPSSSSAPYKIMYEPNLLFHGQDSFSYAVRDTLGLESLNVETTIVTVNHVNHAPALSIGQFSFKSTDKPQLLTLTPTDVDNDNPTFTCTIESLPKKAKIYTSKDVLISKVPTTLEKDNSYYFTSDGKTYQDFTDSFTAKCNDNYPSDPKDSNVATGSISFIYVNQAPTGISTTYELAQDDENFMVSVKGDDLETPNNLQVCITTLPGQGTFTLKDGSLAKVSTSTFTYYGLSELYYTPKKGYSDWNMPGNTGPSDQFTFQIYDGKDRSTQTISYFKISPRNPPSYSGVTSYNVKENEDLAFSIGGNIGGGGKNVYLELVSIKSNGTLYDSVCMGIEGCIIKDKSNAMTTYENPMTNSYNFVFRPVQYENGDNYATIQFKLYDTYGDRKVYSGQYSININVIPVNQLPEIQLISYITQDGVEHFFDSSSSSNEVNIFANTSSVLIKYDGYDIDNAKSELVSLISSLSEKGSLYNYNMDTKSRGNKVVANSHVDISSDGFWYLEYAHETNSSYRYYAKCVISIKDPLDAVSSAQLLFSVVVGNVAPIITTNQSLLNSSVITGNEKKLLGLSYIDPDTALVPTSTHKHTFTLSIVGSDDDIALGIDVAKISFKTNSSCVFSSTSALVTCTGTNVVLNNTLADTTVVIHKDGSYRLKLYVDDLGYMASAQIRDQNHLSATDYYPLSASSLPSTSTTDNKTVLTAAIAASAGGAAIIAAAVWQLLRKTAPPTDAFFGDSPFADGAVSSNPMYEQSMNSSTNPLYEAGDMD